MVPVAVFVALFALASAVPVPDGTPSLSVLPGSGPQVGISLLPATIDVNSIASISNLPAAVSPGISVLPAAVDESNQIVEIPVQHDESPCTACFQYMNQLIEELTSSVSSDVSVQRPSLEAGAGVAVLPADVSSDISSVIRPVVLPADVSSVARPVPLPADLLQRPETIIR